MATDLARAMQAADRARRLAHGATVHVVDDDDAVRGAFGVLLRAAGLDVALHGSAEAFLERQGRADAPVACVVTDLRMPGLDGIGLLRALLARGFSRPVILVTARGDVPVAVQAMKQGAADFIEKPCTDLRLLEAIANALDAKEAPLSDGRPDRAVEAARARLALLSPREREVLGLLAAGRPNKQVAHVLGLSPRTVEIHRGRMMARLGVRSFAEAVRLVVQAEATEFAPASVEPQQR